MQSGTASIGETSLPIGFAGISIDVRRTLAFAGELSVDSLLFLSGPALAMGRKMRREYRRVASRGLAGVRSEEGALLYFSQAIRRHLKDFSDDPSYGGSRIWADGDDWELKSD